MNENETNVLGASDEDVLEGVREHLAAVEPLIPLPPAWQPDGAARALRGREGKMDIHVRPAGLFGLGGLAAAGLIGIVLVLALGPLSMRNGPGAGATTKPGYTTITYQLVTAEVGQPTTEELAAEASILRARLADVGVTVVTVETQAPDLVIVKIPPSVKVQAIRDLLSPSGLLEFVPLPEDQYGTMSSPGPDAVPADGSILDPSLAALIRGDQIDPNGVHVELMSEQWVVMFAFKDQGKALFAEWSTGNVEHYFAITLDRKVLVAPYVASPVTEGQGQIEGGFTESEARTLAAILKAGALPYPLLEVSAEGPGSSPVATPTVSPAPILEPDVVTPSDIPSTGRTLGDPNALVTLDVWSDYRCPGCFAFATEAEPRLIADYVRAGKLKIVYHDFIVVDSPASGSTESRDAANAARCAADQGEFATYQDWLWANQSPTKDPGAYTLDRLIELGRRAGLDTTSFDQCVRGGTHLSEVAAESSGSTLAGVPAFFVNGVRLTGDAGDYSALTYDGFARVIDAILARPTPSIGPGPS